METEYTMHLVQDRYGKRVLNYEPSPGGAATVLGTVTVTAPDLWRAWQRAWNAFVERGLIGPDETESIV
jgi:hypothetical protein